MNKIISLVSLIVLALFCCCCLSICSLFSFKPTFLDSGCLFDEGGFIELRNGQTYISKAGQQVVCQNGKLIFVQPK